MTLPRSRIQCLPWQKKLRSREGSTVATTLSNTKNIEILSSSMLYRSAGEAELARLDRPRGHSSGFGDEKRSMQQSSEEEEEEEEEKRLRSDHSSLTPPTARRRIESQVEEDLPTIIASKISSRNSWTRQWRLSARRRSQIVQWLMIVGWIPSLWESSAMIERVRDGSLEHRASGKRYIHSTGLEKCCCACHSEESDQKQNLQEPFQNLSKSSNATLFPLLSQANPNFTRLRYGLLTLSRVDIGW
ncbi:hypothetical protein SELMODRAFT_413908 [Selaginella moellendorffii]|uniref:Uncharacterized protein n=1 Tax=Selaginella moellendorffii TaxID=88036 RepID=D8RR07_SELML|nr:hypothetical protein SELMODRAFT_413908 [Selaginella moellendorffii]